MPNPSDASSHLGPVSHDGDFAAALNARLDGWNSAMGIHIVRATVDEVTAELQVGTCHRQAYGIVHGGVYAGLIESVSSIAAALWARQHNQSVVGLENHTSFLRAVRDGKLSATARPLMRGRRTQVWEAFVTDGAGQLAAQGKVRLIALEPGSSIAGEQVRIKTNKD
jgi:1,4-dihydroxy-2-naphthoyl-CoA hydrolase